VTLKQASSAALLGLEALSAAPDALSNMNMYHQINLLAMD
jgi:hypothetical protein